MGPMASLSLLVNLLSLLFSLSVCPSSMAYYWSVLSITGGKRAGTWAKDGRDMMGN